MDPRNLMPDLNASVGNREIDGAARPGIDEWFPPDQDGFLPGLFEETYPQAMASAESDGVAAGLSLGGGFRGSGRGATGGAGRVPGRDAGRGARGGRSGTAGGGRGGRSGAAGGVEGGRSGAPRGVVGGVTGGVVDDAAEGTEDFEPSYPGAATSRGGKNVARVAARARGGRRAAAAYRRPRPSAGGAGTSDAAGEGSGVGHVPDDFERAEMHKADWNSSNNRVFCELCVVETQLGNRPSGIMSTRGFNNIAPKYYIRTGLRHDKQQFKNRWDALRALYTFWVWCNKASGLGWDDTLGTVVASDAWWKKNTKKKSEWKKVKYGPPDCVELLEQMFHGTVVDGSTSCVPGEEHFGEDEREETQGAEDEPMATDSPRSSNQLKRGSTVSSASSPSKKSKSPLVKILKDIRETMQTNNAIAKKVLQGEVKYELIKEVMTMVVACGAKAGTVEHFMASQLFVKEEHRYVFQTLETDEERLCWLKQWCKLKGLSQ